MDPAPGQRPARSRSRRTPSLIVLDPSLPLCCRFLFASLYSLLSAISILTMDSSLPQSRSGNWNIDFYYHSSRSNLGLGQQSTHQYTRLPKPARHERNRTRTSNSAECPVGSSRRGWPESTWQVGVSRVRHSLRLQQSGMCQHELRTQRAERLHRQMLPKHIYEQRCWWLRRVPCWICPSGRQMLPLVRCAHKCSRRLGSECFQIGPVGRGQVWLAAYIICGFICFFICLGWLVFCWFSIPSETVTSVTLSLSS